MVVSSPGSPEVSTLHLSIPEGVLAWLPSKPPRVLSSVVCVQAEAYRKVASAVVSRLQEVTEAVNRKSA